MDNFYKKCKNLSKNEGVLGVNEAQIESQKEQGRSMVEMLGVLAIIGVLSIGAISGYRYAMNKYRANQVTNELNLLSHQVAIAMMGKNGLSGELKLGEPYDTNKKLSSAGYDFAFGCGESGTDTPCQNQTKFHFEVQKVSEGVCKELVQMTEHLQDLVSRTETCTTGTTDLQFVFDIPDAAGNGGAGTETPEETTEPNPKNCSGHGFYGYGKCVCNAGYSGTECQTADQSCSGKGHWTGSGCSCDSGSAGKNCEYSSTGYCHERGRWHDYLGSCGYCEDSYGYYCELEEDPCLNGGNWASWAAGCDCASGFAGEYCEEKEADVCKNGSTWDIWSCRCPTGYKGYDCSIKIYMSDFDDFSDYRD